ncbi:MAG: DUF5067 domain-containing protein [Bifidobacteriaceae bacterium]|jgi:predicted lipid-binding transport protein (Tim44 family)|nr:DUF5067 domain-containing protein [Bifidobacteriaceae bacterium]
MSENIPQHTPGSHTPQAFGSAPEPDRSKSTTASGIAALVLGIIGAILSFIPIINNFAIVVAIIGLIFGIIGIVATKKTGKKKGRGIAIAATILSVVALVISFSMQAAFSSAFDSAGKDSGSTTSDTSSESSKKSESSKDSADSSDSAAKSSASGEQKNEGDLTGAHASIESLTKSVNDYNGKPTVLVSITWKNTSSDNQMITTALNPKVYQNGKSLDSAIYTNAPKGYDAEAELTEIKAGASATTILAYTLEDSTTPVEVELSNLFDNGTKITRTFKL